MTGITKKTHDSDVNCNADDYKKLCRLCGRFNLNMTSIFDITNKYDYSKVINIHFREFQVSESDILPLKLCINCIATLTAWHEYYNNCIDVNKRLKSLQLKPVVMTTNQIKSIPSKNKANNSSIPLYELDSDDEPTLELRQLDEENSERDVSNLTDDIEVIEIKINEDENSEMDAEELYDDSSCTEDVFDDIANIHIQEDTPYLPPLDGYQNVSVKDEKLDSEEMAILQHDLNTKVKDSVGENETEKTVEQPSSRKNENFNKIKKSTVCRICGKLYVTRTSYLRHLLKQHSNHTSVKPRNVSVKSMASEKKMVANEDSHQKQKRSHGSKEEPSRIMCDVCGKTFRFASSYRKHARDYHSDEPPKPKPLRSRRMCDLCGKICSGGSFKGHMKKHTNPESVTCPHCGQLFSFESVLKSHIKVRHSNERPFQCKLCDSSFKRADYLRSHMRYKHEPKLLRSEEKSFPHRCNDCDSTFKNQEALDKHHNYKALAGGVEGAAGGATTCERKCPAVFRCDECQISFRRRNYLTLHKRYVHDKQQPFRISEASVGPYKCDRCERRFASVCGRNYHCKSVHGCLYETKFSEMCDHCGLTFRNRVFYAKHCAKLRDKPTCYLCWSAFDEDAALKQHMHDVHVDDLPFLCELCHSRFVTMRQLTDHIRSRHAKIRPFKCSYCAHTAVRKDSLEVHIRSCHLGQKPFKCDLCEKAFSQSSDLRKHRVTHTRNKLTHVKKKKIQLEEPFVAVDVKFETTDADAKFETTDADAKFETA